MQNEFFNKFWQRAKLYSFILKIGISYDSDIPDFLFFSN